MHEEFRVSQYVLERKLGQGGMAEVWKARHLHLGSSAAVKFLLPHLAGDPQLEDRFLEEGRRQAMLQHQNIVAAMDFVQQDGRSYLIMEFVEGENLETKLSGQARFSLEEVHTICWDVLSALDHAHAMGVVHRDVKPSNILIGKNGQVWLTDFGIALALSEERRVTVTGTAVGTPEYMSPEQILRPREVDARSDIYSFGCVLYALLSGDPPFGMNGATDFYIKDCHVRTPPPPLVYRNSNISPEVERVVMRCLEKDPARRFQNCGEVMEALNAAISVPAGSTPPPPLSPGYQGVVLPVPPPTPVPRPVMPLGAAPVSAFAARSAPTPAPANPGPPTPQPEPKRGKRKLAIYAVLAVVLLAAAVGSYFLFFLPPETVLRLEGSTTVGNELAPALLVAFLKSEGATDIEALPVEGDKRQHHDVRAKLPGQWRPVLFSVVANGSANSFKALEAGRAEVGMASRPIQDDEVRKLRSMGDMRSPACENVVGLDGLAVVVNRGNPLPPLTLKQLKMIFDGEVTDWGDPRIGGHPGPIHLYGRDTDSGTYDTFATLVMDDKKTPFSKTLTVEHDGDVIATKVAADPGGIGYVGLAQIGNAKPVALSGGAGTTPLLPSKFTVATEDYVLSRRLFLYVPANPTEWARKFVNFALSPDGQKVVANIYVEQIPDFEREHKALPANAPPAYAEAVAGLRRMNVNFRFLPNSILLDNKALADISRAASVLTQNNIHSVKVFGFADSLGSTAQNEKLSQERAKAVADELSKYDITVVPMGFGSAMPVADNSTPEGREKNRRVEIWAQ